MPTERRVFKIKAELRGGHFHVDFYSSKGWDQTFAKLGSLVMDPADWYNFVETSDDERIRFTQAGA